MEIGLAENQEVYGDVERVVCATRAQTTISFRMAHPETGEKVVGVGYDGDGDSGVVEMMVW